MVTLTASPAPSSSTIVTNPPPPPRKNVSHRLLYRGALSLPDSEITLEGITFVANLPCNSPGPLITSPIPLALESMRGRSALRLVGVVKTLDVRLELSDEISMYIHPDAFLTHTFFHRVLSLPNLNLAPLSSSANPITEFAIRIGLNDGSGADDSDLLIYGVPSIAATARESTKMRLCVSRLAPLTLHPSPVKRTPRPDDPAPRPHPLAHLSVNNRSNTHPLGLKRKRSAMGDTLSALASACQEAERQRKLGKAPSFTFGGSAGGVGLGINLLSRGGMVDQDGFLIPSTPTRVGKKARTSMHAGVVEIGTKAKPITGREKDKVKVFSVPAKVEKKDAGADESEIETNNKTAIKKRTLSTLTDHGIPKSHETFQELYARVTRGTEFSLRRTITNMKVDQELIQRLVSAHVGMYLDGLGGNYACAASTGQPNTEEKGIQLQNA